MSKRNPVVSGDGATSPVSNSGEGIDPNNDQLSETTDKLNITTPGDLAKDSTNPSAPLEVTSSEAPTGDNSPAPKEAEGDGDESNENLKLGEESKAPTTSGDSKSILVLHNTSSFNLDYFKGSNKFTIHKGAKIPVSAIPSWVMTNPEYKLHRKDKSFEIKPLK